MNPFKSFLQFITRYFKGEYMKQNLLNPSGKNSMWSDIGAIGQGISDTVEGITNKYSGVALTPADRESWMLGEQSAQNQRAWEEQMSNTAHQRSVSDMRAAGLNPALMYGSGSAASTPSGAAAGSPGVSSAGLSELLGMLLLPLQAKQIKSETDNAEASAAQKRADASRSQAETEKVRTETAWIDRLNQANIDSVNANKSLSEARVREIDQSIEVAKAEVKKKLAETATEEERKSLTIAQRLLTQASAREINALLPYKAALMTAQTEQARAAASLSAVQAAYQNHMIDSGYIEDLCAELKARASSAESKAAVDALRSAMRTGQAFGDPITLFLDKYGLISPNSLLGGITNFIDLIPLRPSL